MVLVMDPGSPSTASNDPVFKQGEKKSVVARRILCEWDKWPDQVAAAATTTAKPRKPASESFDARLADRVRPDPDRPLPNLYEEEGYWPSSLDEDERRKLAKAYIKSFGLGQFANAADLIPLVSSLPVLVTRDLLGAGGRRTNEPGTVSAVFARAAEVLDCARLNLPSGDSPGSPPRAWYELITDLEVEFLNAVRTWARGQGSEITLPWVPRLPDWVDGEEQGLLKSFGWLRMALGDTSGRNMHAPGCHTIRSGSGLLADHLPLWQVVVEDQKNLCGVCGGPGLRDLLEFSGFIAAADVWSSRGNAELERWQVVAID
jgi:hypothetical protein